MNAAWPIVSLGELIRLERRPVNVIANHQYQEIGTYSYGRGIFHKTPRSGLEVGNKDLFLMKEGDVILQITFAWEGAIALCSRAEDGLFGSVRYPTFRVNEERCYAPFLVRYLTTREGLEQIGRICPGSAGRNRVLAIKRLPEVKIPLPPHDEQRRIVARIEELRAKAEEALRLRQSAAVQMGLLVSLHASVLLGNEAWRRVELRTVLAEKPRNGLSPKPEIDSGGRPMLRINSVSSSPTRYVDTSAAKLVDVSDAEADPFVLQNNDVFIVRYNGDINRVAKAAIYIGYNHERIVYPDKLIRLRPNVDRMTPEFLVYALGSRTVRAQIEELGRTTAGNIGVSGGDAQSFVVPLPPLSEQHRIVAELDALQAGVDSAKTLQAETATELDALFPAVLDKAFKGGYSDTMSAAQNAAEGVSKATSSIQSTQ